MSTIPEDLLSPPGETDRPADERLRRRWQVWRSPADQPWWARPVLLGIVVATAVLYAWNITQAGLAPFYSVAVKSMSESWKAFVFGAFDPKATITIDKLAGSFLPQALSARIFGYHAWSLALPQVIEGVISVLVMYRVVRRWAGVVPGLLAAVIFTLTPITASMFGHSMEDGALTMCLVLAADSCQRAITQARLRPLIWAGIWVGLGFQAKMLQAWMILPALAAGYLVGAPAPLRRRLRQLTIAGTVMLAVSLSWVALYTFTPARDRPYIDGSTNNSAIAMVFGYNGLERFGISINGAVTSGPGGTGTEAPGQPGLGRRDSSPASGAGAAQDDILAGGSAPGSGWAKLLGEEYGPQIGWLYPLAVLALVFGLVWVGQARRSRQVRAGFVMWGTWLLTVGLVFSKMSAIPHTAYMSSLAPPLAALSAAGIVLFWRAYRAGGRRAWLLSAAVAAEVAWALFLWRDYSGFLPWARDALVVAGAAAIVVLTAAKLSRRGRTLVVSTALTAATAAMLAAPAAWAASVLDTKYGGSSFNASAGPTLRGGLHFAVDPVGSGAVGPGRRGGGSGHASFPGTAGTPGTAPAGGLAGGTTTTLTAAEQRIYQYVSAHRDGAGYLMATGSWIEAGTYILATGQEVLAMGGFTGSVPEPTLAGVRELVRTGQLRFFLISGTGSTAGQGGGIGQPNPAASAQGTTAVAIDSWVRRACTEVPAQDYGAAATASASGADGGAETLYACARSA
jgi:4-amino-4-deoxy-L-arabinose transferase-like glycosyltransferase